MGVFSLRIAGRVATLVFIHGKNYFAGCALLDSACPLRREQSIERGGDSFEVWPDMATPKKPGAQRGRPPQDFWTDPHRYAIAIALGLQQIGLSERRSFNLVAALLLGKKVDEHLTLPRRKPGVGTTPAGRLATYERVRHLITTSASFGSFHSTLKKKARRISDDAARLWLAANAQGIAAFLSTGYLLGYDLEQLVGHVAVCADRAVADTLPVQFLDALTFDPQYIPQVNAPDGAYK
jgi:hypothetical protein